MSKIVKIYSTPICPYCKMAKQYLTENNIPFEDVDVASNQTATREMISKSSQMGVPVFDIDGQIIVGFDKTKIKQLLGI
ncbi:NrdH-redoxin [candidate division WOR-1 bacterium RIFCSPLOWO2_02_FULL_46_20]|uniref:NrdH-redoxin n=2 Tax=Saganbacteria TaxID=1703751 RepID=A0A1F4RAY3_UNCSA|nr:MAG: NrdH-redoxin [candidate division WOR-1 bacterium RIFCSPHIGHO2_02_FULL_45_12]OGC05325.1 MAG: NrdH-redoxin [candidate division WOR-1 bacterium RIFCSPLOWO2_02_FULL_46_20]OGC08388.1 MAG: NrdH-redoxin [candidate division WOR-1 bacterium RIFCSPLOWO2_12_FULL_45_9]